MKSKKRLALFTVVAIVQLFAVLYMAWQWENTLQTGQRFLWETAPVDPYDAFKGRYIDLGFKESSAPVADGSHLSHGEKAYAIIDENEAGMAYISSISAQPPPGKPFVKVKVYYVDRGKAHVRLPFRRYYLPEHLAAPAEIAYRESAGKTGVAAIRLKDGHGVVEELYISDKTLEEYLRTSMP